MGPTQVRGWLPKLSTQELRSLIYQQHKRLKKLEALKDKYREQMHAMYKDDHWRVQALWALNRDRERMEAFIRIKGLMKDYLRYAGELAARDAEYAAEIEIQENRNEEQQVETVGD